MEDDVMMEYVLIGGYQTDGDMGLNSAFLSYEEAHRTGRQRILSNFWTTFKIETRFRAPKEHEQTATIPLPPRDPNYERHETAALSPIFVHTARHDDLLRCQTFRTLTDENNNKVTLRCNLKKHHLGWHKIPELMWSPWMKDKG